MAVAKRRLRRIRVAIRTGKWTELKIRLSRKRVCVPVRSKEILTIAGLAKIYLMEYCQKYNTRPDYKEHALKPITRILGSIPVGEFRRRDAHSFIAVRTTEVSAATVNRSLQVLKNMFSFAIDKEYVEAHPLHHFKLLKEKRYPMRILSLAEYRSLVDAVASIDSVIGAYVAVLGETGLRKSEGLRLKWSDVNVTERRLTVANSKSGEPRYVPLTDYAVDWLSSLPRVINCQHVFVQLDRMRPWMNPIGPFQKGKKAADLDFVRGFHDLRHFRATQWLVHGVDVKTVSELLGHADIATTQRYVHYLQDHAKKAVRQAEQLEQLQLASGRKVDGEGEEEQRAS